MAADTGNVDYRLRDALSTLVLCSRCLQNGKVRPIRQFISSVRKPRNICNDCRSNGDRAVTRRAMGKVVDFASRRD